MACDESERKSADEPINEHLKHLLARRNLRTLAAVDEPRDRHAERLGDLARCLGARMLAYSALNQSNVTSRQPGFLVESGARNVLLFASPLEPFGECVHVSRLCQTTLEPSTTIVALRKENFFFDSTMRRA